MNHFKIILAFIFLNSLLSCTKDLNNQNSAYNPGLMSADIGGSLWFANSGFVQTPNMSTLNLYGTYNSQSHLTIGINNYSGPGSYNLGGFNTAIFSDANGNEYDATNGVLYITSDNSIQVLGTFYFSGFSTIGGYPISVSNGQFNLSR